MNTIPSKKMIYCVITFTKLYQQYEFAIWWLSGMRLGFGPNSGKFYDAIDSNPIQHRRF